MKERMRVRNVRVNSYFAILLITIAGASACFLILHVEYNASIHDFITATLPNS